MKKAFSSAALTAATMALSAAPVLAIEPINISPAGSEFNALTGATIPKMVTALVKIVLIVAAVIFFFMLVIGGIQWMTSGGDKAAAEAARGRVTAALIGLVIVFAAYAIIYLVQGLFGLNVLNFTVPTFIGG